MHTDSSASRTCSESRSASLKTATVAMRSSRHARMTRSAISPRLAIRTLRNTRSFAAGPARSSRRRAGRLGVGVGAHRAPHAIGGGGDALELERQLVRVVAVPECFFLADDAIAQQRQHRLVERLHAV